jgi:hypothetical protein
MSERITKDLVMQALFRAVSRRPKPGLIQHTDCGAQRAFNRSSQHQIVEQILGTRPGDLSPAAFTQWFYLDRTAA